MVFVVLHIILIFSKRQTGFFNNNTQNLPNLLLIVVKTDLKKYIRLKLRLKLKSEKNINRLKSGC